MNIFSWASDTFFVLRLRLKAYYLKRAIKTEQKILNELPIRHRNSVARETRKYQDVLRGLDHTVERQTLEARVRREQLVIDLNRINEDFPSLEQTSWKSLFTKDEPKEESCANQAS